MYTATELLIHLSRYEQTEGERERGGGRKAKMITMYGYRIIDPFS